MASPGDWTSSLSLELLFLLLTSWAPIWIYACGLYDHVEERDDVQNVNSAYLCVVATLKYGWYIVGYGTLYTLLAVYATDENPSSDLVTWIAVVYGALVVFQMIVVCRRRYDSDMAYKYYKVAGMDRYAKVDNPMYKRHRFSVVGRVKDYVEERRRLQRRKKQLEDEMKAWRQRPASEERRRTLRRLQTEIDVLTSEMEELYDDDIDDDGYDTAEEYPDDLKF